MWRGDSHLGDLGVQGHGEYRRLFENEGKA